MTKQTKKPATTKISTHYFPSVDGVLSKWHASLSHDTKTGRYIATEIMGSVAQSTSFFATQTRAEDHIYALGYTDSVSESGIGGAS